MFYGSSMGGFMSMVLSILVRNSVSIAEIPMFDLRTMTNWSYLRETLFKDLTLEEIDEKYLYRMNVIELIKKEKYIPNVYLLLDCSSENDYKLYQPLFRQLTDLPYIENNNHNQIKIRIEGKNEGHHQMSHSNLYNIINDIEMLMDSSNNKNIKSSVKINFSDETVLNPESGDLLLKYATGRIDFVNYGKNNSVELLNSNDPNLIVKKINWIDPADGSGIITQSIKGNLNLTVQCINDGKLTVTLRGVYYKSNDNKTFPVYLDFKNFKINDKSIFEGSKVLWHNKPFKYTLNVKDKQIVNIHAEWLPFNKKSNFSS